jgi:hypothetical protein
MKKGSTFVYLAAICLFLLGVLAQVYLAGMAVVALQISWNSHVSLGHFVAGPLVLMLVSMYLGRFPRPVKGLTWLLFAIYVLQADVVIFLRFQAPLVGALHPVLALVDFALGLALARRAWVLTKQFQPQPAQPSHKELSTNP